MSTLRDLVRRAETRGLNHRFLAENTNGQGCPWPFIVNIEVLAVLPSYALAVARALSRALRRLLYRETVLLWRMPFWTLLSRVETVSRYWV
jgi:hypothetical protein